MNRERLKEEAKTVGTGFLIMAGSWGFYLVLDPIVGRLQEVIPPEMVIVAALVPLLVLMAWFLGRFVRLFDEEW